MTGFARLCISLASIVLSALFLSAESPTAATVLDRYVKATGGAAAWHSIHSERDQIEGRTLDGERVVLRATVSTSRAGDSVSNVQIPQEGSEGVYKGAAWAVSEFSGVRIKHGLERSEALRDARILEEADWRSLYPKSRIVGIESIGGESCYKIALLPSSAGRTEWFSISTDCWCAALLPKSPHRVIRRRGIQSSNGGSTTASDSPV